MYSFGSFNKLQLGQSAKIGEKWVLLLAMASLLLAQCKYKSLRQQIDITSNSNTNYICMHACVSIIQYKKLHHFEIYIWRFLKFKLMVMSMFFWEKNIIFYFIRWQKLSRWSRKSVSFSSRKRLPKLDQKFAWVNILI